MTLIVYVKCDCPSNTAILPVMSCSMLIPGNVAGVAKQFLRCMFHQLAPNGILPQLFQSNIKGLFKNLKIQLELVIEKKLSFTLYCNVGTFKHSI